MAFLRLEACLCCSLITGAIVSSIYTAIVYLAALSLQLYWIIEVDVALPAPAYIQAATYLVTIVMSMVMFIGILLKRCQFLMGWLFMMILFWLPEAGLVILMTVHHWGLSSKNGTIEISLWICRATANILCVVCVHSLYASWRDEKTVMRRLKNLNMTSVLPDNGKDSNGNLRETIIKSNGSTSPYLGYRNHGYISSNEFLTGSTDDGVNNKNRMVGRSSSSVSYLHYHNSLTNRDRFGNNKSGVFISNDDLNRLEHLHAIHQILEKNQRDKSEFNPYTIPSNMNPMLANNNADYGANISYSSSFSDLHSYRPRSMTVSGDSNCLSRQLSFVRGNQCHVHPEFSTQSLDRSKYLRFGRRKRSTSMDDLDLKLSSEDITLEKVQHQPFEYLNRPGSRQASEIGSEVERIKDVAL